MAYDPENPPSLMVQNIGGTVGLRHYALMWTDPIATVLTPGYISNAEEIGMRAGDVFQYSDVNMGQWSTYFLICTAIAADGSATLEFPEVPEEALPLEASFDPDDGDSYAVVYKDGRQVRVDMAAFGEALVAIATQAEAEAGSINTKRMTPLRVFQAIAAYIAGRAAKATPVDADGIIITDSADLGAAKQVSLANLRAAILSALGTTIGALTSKATPVDADGLLISDSADAGVQKRLPWANVKATLLTYFLTTFPRYDTSQTLTAPQQAQVRSNIGAINSPWALSYDSGEQVITSGGFLTLVHGLGGMPNHVHLVLRCKTAEHGYAVDDEIDVQDFENADRGVIVVRRATTIVPLFGTATSVFTGKDTATRAGVFLTNANWRLIVRAYR
jgi:hypothetical protein